MPMCMLATLPEPLTCMWPRPPRLRAVLTQARCTSGVSVEQASSCRGEGGEGAGSADWHLNVSNNRRQAGCVSGTQLRPAS